MRKDYIVIYTSILSIVDETSQTTAKCVRNAAEMLRIVSIWPDIVQKTAKQLCDVEFILPF